MSALAVNSLIEKFVKSDIPQTVTKPTIVDRHHFSAPSYNSFKRYEYTHDYEGQHLYGHSGHKSGKRSIALSALTLLSFLFFLNILQNCLQDHMDEMNTTSTTQVIIMQARQKAAREAEEAQKRKGETLDPLDPIYDNTTIVKEPRTSQKIKPKLKPKNYVSKITQIPVKLKIIDRYGNP